jgi:hypothetical protein
MLRLILCCKRSCEGDTETARLTRGCVICAGCIFGAIILYFILLGIGWVSGKYFDDLTSVGIMFSCTKSPEATFWIWCPVGGSIILLLMCSVLGLAFLGTYGLTLTCIDGCKKYCVEWKKNWEMAGHPEYEPPRQPVNVG